MVLFSWETAASDSVGAEYLTSLQARRERNRGRGGTVTRKTALEEKRLVVLGAAAFAAMATATAAATATTADKNEGRGVGNKPTLETR